jgi:hypothetical protein
MPQQQEVNSEIWNMQTKLPGAGAGQTTVGTIAVISTCSRLQQQQEVDKEICMLHIKLPGAAAG